MCMCVRGGGEKHVRKGEGSTHEVEQDFAKVRWEAQSQQGGPSTHNGKGEPWVQGVNGMK